MSIAVGVAGAGRLQLRASSAPVPKAVLGSREAGVGKKCYCCSFCCESECALSTIGAGSAEELMGRKAL
jgi:hypothetical protein